jgi:hypothetical protein
LKGRARDRAGKWSRGGETQAGLFRRAKLDRPPV